MALLPVTWGVKLGTQPFGAVEDPMPISVGDIRWFREGSPGKLFKRPVRNAERVVVTRVLTGHVSLDYR